MKVCNNTVHRVEMTFYGEFGDPIYRMTKRMETYNDALVVDEVMIKDYQNSLDKEIIKRNKQEIETLERNIRLREEGKL